MTAPETDHAAAAEVPMDVQRRDLHRRTDRRIEGRAELGAALHRTDLTPGRVALYPSDGLT